MELRGRNIVLGVAVVLSMVAAMFLLARDLATTSAVGGPGAFSLNVETGGTCDDPDEPTKCDVALSGRFTLSVAVDSLPAAGEYIGIGSDILIGDDLTYNPAASAEDEIVWPDAGGLFVRIDYPPGRVRHGAGTANTPPFPTSSATGNIVEFSLACSASESSTMVRLPVYDTDNNTYGAGFRVSPEEIAPAKSIGTENLDLNRDGAQDMDGTGALIDYGIADTLEINCSAAAPTPTVPVGDANCDGTVNSIDAALVLQFAAGLIGSLDCQDAADANCEGTVNAIDAALILQHDAGLLPELPCA